MREGNGEIMRLKEARCRNCYKCIRSCPVKAIAITGDHAVIREDLCVYCGNCYLVCPQDARDLLGDLDRVKMMIASGQKVYVSLSSGFSSYFETTNLQEMGAVLKKLGVTRVEETAVGGNRVVAEYEEIIEKHEDNNLISSICPASNFLVQKYFPKEVKWLMPVDTPLEAHAKLMRAAYGEDIKVVGIGPCLAYQKLSALADDGKLIDAYINYEELTEWMAEKDVSLNGDVDLETIPASNYRGRYLDEVGGLFRALPSETKYSYKVWEVTGTSRVKDMLKGLNHKNFNGYMLHVASCANNCLGGPLVRLANRDTFTSKDRWLNSLKEDMSLSESGSNPSESAIVDVRKTYEPLDMDVITPEREQVEYFLSLIGREDPKDRLDCSGCGYPTCVAKAVAVCRGLADPFMCIPHSRDKAEAQSNLLFYYSPSGVAIMDKNLRIVELNAVAESIFDMKAEEAKAHSIKEFIDPDFMEHAMLKEVDVIRDRLDCSAIGKVLAVTFFKVPGHDLVILVMDDHTEDAEKFRKSKEMRDETIDVVQNVVSKQMRIAQEIASLLGETTAETKLALNRMKKMLGESENEKDGWQ